MTTRNLDCKTGWRLRRKIFYRLLCHLSVWPQISSSALSFAGLHLCTKGYVTLWTSFPPFVYLCWLTSLGLFLVSTDVRWEAGFLFTWSNTFDFFLNFSIQNIDRYFLNVQGKKEKVKMIYSLEHKAMSRSKIKVLVVKLLWKLVSSVYGARFYMLMNFGYAEELLDVSENVSKVVSHFRSVLQGKAIAVRVVPPLDIC